MTFGALTDLLNEGRRVDKNNLLALSFDTSNIKDEIIRLNTEDQLYKEGVNADNVLLSSIGGSYAPYTLELKEGTRPINSPTLIDLFDTGAFYNSFVVLVDKKGVIIEADTVKDDGDLMDRWGENILGLNEESIEHLSAFVSPYVSQKLIMILLK